MRSNTEVTIGRFLYVAMAIIIFIAATHAIAEQQEPSTQNTVQEPSEQTDPKQDQQPNAGSQDDSGKQEEAESGEEDDLLDMSLEELMATPIEEAMNVEVALTSRKQERLFDTPAAVYVVTAEDIRRTGATSVPEALRMVPGVQVSRINSNAWAITARGFQDQFGNKLLVLVDGRSIYSTHCSGVFWDVQDMILEDIERIEVIRGPGGTLWGANAVNGIINIVTKSAKDTQGFLITGGWGKEEQGMGAVRYGGKLGEEAHYRIYAKYANYGDSIGLATTNNLGDSWDLVKGGFRFDWDKSKDDLLTLQGDIYYGDVGVSGSDITSALLAQGPITHVSGGNILGRWTHTFSETSDMIVQMYYDHFARLNPTVRHTDDSFDLDFQHRFALGERQEITWGLGYRYSNNLFNSDREEQRIPHRRQTNTYTGFIQDKITLAEDKLYLTLGSKFEDNDYTGFEYQPSGRLLWIPNEKNTFWGAASRVVRTASRRENDTYYDTGIQGGMRVTTIGNESWNSEEIFSYELGYRVQPADNFFLDLTGFYNDFSNLLSHETSLTFQPNPVPHMWMYNMFDNKMAGEVYGVEVAANWNITENWQLAGGYTFLQMQLHMDSSSTSIMMDEVLEHDSPHNQAHLRSYLDLPGNLELDTALYYVDSLHGMDVPSHLRWDVRLGWHVSEKMELSAVVRNILDDYHSEFQSNITDDGEIGRSFFIKLTYSF